MEPPVGIEPTSPSYESVALPLSYDGNGAGRFRLLLRKAVKRRSLYGLATRPHKLAERIGIEPNTGWCEPLSKRSQSLTGLRSLAAGGGIEPLTFRIACFSRTVCALRATRQNGQQKSPVSMFDGMN